MSSSSAPPKNKGNKFKHDVKTCQILIDPMNLLFKKVMSVCPCWQTWTKSSLKEFLQEALVRQSEMDAFAKHSCTEQTCCRRYCKNRGTTISQNTVERDSCGTLSGHAITIRTVGALFQNTFCLLLADALVQKAVISPINYEMVWMRDQYKQSKIKNTPCRMEKDPGWEMSFAWIWNVFATFWSSHLSLCIGLITFWG